MLALKFDEPVRDVIFIEEIIELMSFACVACRENAKPGKFPIASEATATHDECVHDGRAHTRYFGERAPEFGRWHFENFRFRRSHAGGSQGGCALQHRDVADEIALACGRENLFRAIARFENFDLAAQDYREAKIALAGFINQFAAFQDAPLCQWLEQRKLVIVQFGKGDAFRVAIKLFVLLFVRCHFRTLRVATSDQNAKIPGVASN